MGGRGLGDPPLLCCFCEFFTKRLSYIQWNHLHICCESSEKSLEWFRHEYYLPFIFPSNAWVEYVNCSRWISNRNSYIRVVLAEISRNWDLFPKTLFCKDFCFPRLCFLFYSRPLQKTIKQKRIESLAYQNHFCNFFGQIKKKIKYWLKLKILFSWSCLSIYFSNL